MRGMAIDTRRSKNSRPEAGSAAAVSDAGPLRPEACVSSSIRLSCMICSAYLGSTYCEYSERSSGVASSGTVFSAVKSCSVARARPSMTESAILLVKRRMARRASSLPGMTQSTSSGSQLVSTMATTGMPRRRASLTAMASLFESMRKVTSGRPGISLMPVGRPRKFVYGRAITFHLNHPPAPRGHHAASLARLAQTIADRKIRCAHGLDRHL